jgi:hypothetical protein
MWRWWRQKMTLQPKEQVFDFFARMMQPEKGCCGMTTLEKMTTFENCDCLEKAVYN